jgi:predicted SpoU family rRNA methylase
MTEIYLALVGQAFCANAIVAATDKKKLEKGIQKIKHDWGPDAYVVSRFHSKDGLIVVDEH